MTGLNAQKGRPTYSSNQAPNKETWDFLCKATGRTDFLYVADSKLCNRPAMDHIHYQGGRLVTVLPRTRLEDREFRDWIQTNTPHWGPGPSLLALLLDPASRRGPGPGGGDSIEAD